MVRSDVSRFRGGTGVYWGDYRFLDEWAGAGPVSMTVPMGVKEPDVYSAEKVKAVTARDANWGETVPDGNWDVKAMVAMARDG